MKLPGNAIVGCAALGIGIGFVQAKEPRLDTVKKEITNVVKALYKADYKLILKHTHEKVLEAVGGKDTYLASIKEAHKTVTAAKMSVVKVEFGKKIDYFEGEENEFFLVPAKITMKIGDQTETVPGHQFGVKRKSEKVWKYIDCSGITDELARKMFPDLPRNKKIPEG